MHDDQSFRKVRSILKHEVSDDPDHSVVHHLPTQRNGGVSQWLIDRTELTSLQSDRPTLLRHCSRRRAMCRAITWRRGIIIADRTCTSSSARRARSKRRPGYAGRRPKHVFRNVSFVDRRSLVGCTLRRPQLTFARHVPRCAPRGTIPSGGRLRPTEQALRMRCFGEPSGG